MDQKPLVVFLKFCFCGGEKRGPHSPSPGPGGELVSPLNSWTPGATCSVGAGQVGERDASECDGCPTRQGLGSLHTKLTDILWYTECITDSSMRRGKNFPILFVWYRRGLSIGSSVRGQHIPGPPPVQDPTSSACLASSRLLSRS